MKRVLLSIALLAVIGCGCSRKVESAGGVEIATVDKLTLNSSGHTVEQQNLLDRMKRDNDHGAIKHLYLISSYSGQVLLYSPVKGKVTSTSKRLTPRSIKSDGTYLPQIEVGGRKYGVDELPAEDGTYGQSTDAIFWFTPDGRYHQEILNGGVIVHISDNPIAVKGTVITIESK